MCQLKNDKYQVYIYGMGDEYNKLASYLTLYKSKMDIIGIVTTEKQMISQIDGYPCITVQEMDADKMDYIIIAVKRWHQIADILENYGVDENRIIRGSVFYYPNFDLEKYLRLKSSSVSILSNFCLGGGGGI